MACGRCIGCRLDRSRSWAIRCVHEGQVHEASCVCGCQRGEEPKNCFITLTYDDEHLPADWSVDVREWQLFAKRLRKRSGPFRFLHCGEYGGENLRPHYHAVLFGKEFGDKEQVCVNRRGEPVFSSQELSEVWGKGFVTVGDLTWQSAAYVARYVVKKVTGPQAEEAYCRVDAESGECVEVRPEYATMSRRPGIGSAWLSRFKKDVYPDDFVVHDGRKFRPPSFYDRRLSESELQATKDERKRRALLRPGEGSEARLKVRESVCSSRVRRLRREV